MQFLIWSNQHGRWWRPDERGYTPFIEEAGPYSRPDAERIVAKATLNGRLFKAVADPSGRSYQRFDEYMVIAPEFVPDEP